jgi:hypothetical protein
MKIGKDKRGGENGENCAGGVAQDEALSSNSSTKKKKRKKLLGFWSGAGNSNL